MFQIAEDTIQALKFIFNVEKVIVEDAGNAKHCPLSTVPYNLFPLTFLTAELFFILVLQDMINLNFNSAVAQACKLQARRKYQLRNLPSATTEKAALQGVSFCLICRKARQFQRLKRAVIILNCMQKIRAYAFCRFEHCTALFDETGKKISAVREGRHFKTPAERQIYIDKGYISVTAQENFLYSGFAKKKYIRDSLRSA